MKLTTKALAMGLMLVAGVAIAAEATDPTVKARQELMDTIGMNIGIMPITGVPLPFISYGGSSIFAIWMAVGLLQNIKIKHSD